MLLRARQQQEDTVLGAASLAQQQQQAWVIQHLRIKQLHHQQQQSQLLGLSFDGTEASSLLYGANLHNDNPRRDFVLTGQYQQQTLASSSFSLGTNTGGHLSSSPMATADRFRELNAGAAAVSTDHNPTTIAGERMATREMVDDDKVTLPDRYNNDDDEYDEDDEDEEEDVQAAEDSVGTQSKTRKRESMSSTTTETSVKSSKPCKQRRK